jgi:hypothetical protein
MSIKVPLPIVLAIALATVLGLVTPVLAQFNQGSEQREWPNSDRRAIQRVLDLYEAAFNARDIEQRMALCTSTYHEYGFENGDFVFAKNYDETKRDVGGYWAGLSGLEYSMDDVEIAVDGPMAMVKAYTTHLAPGDSHASVVYFAMVKIDRRWWIAWDSYNIIRRFE